MKILKKLVLLVILFAIASLVDAEEKEDLFGGTVSGNLKFSNDYAFRGESETADGEIPAIQASLTWSNQNGFYFGVFGSTNKFESSPDIYAVIGPYVGRSDDFAQSSFSYNVFVFHYMYPGATRFD